MPRAKGNDLCEIFGYTPDDVSESARKQWKSQQCPFVEGVCIKHDHSNSIVYGTCSVVNKTRGGVEEVIICPQRLYADNYATLKSCLKDAIGQELPILTATEYSVKKKGGKLPSDYFVLFGQKCGKEISL